MDNTSEPISAPINEPENNKNPENKNNIQTQNDKNSPNIKPKPSESLKKKKTNKEKISLNKKNNIPFPAPKNKNISYYEIANSTRNNKIKNQKQNSYNNISIFEIKNCPTIIKRNSSTIGNGYASTGEGSDSETTKTVSIKNEIYSPTRNCSYRVINETRKNSNGEKCIKKKILDINQNKNDKKIIIKEVNTINNDGKKVIIKEVNKINDNNKKIINEYNNQVFYDSNKKIITNENIKKYDEFNNQIIIPNNNNSSCSINSKIEKNIIKQNNINNIDEQNIIINNGFVNMNNNYYLNQKEKNENKMKSDKINDFNININQQSIIDNKQNSSNSRLIRYSEDEEEPNFKIETKQIKNNNNSVIYNKKNNYNAMNNQNNKNKVENNNFIKTVNSPKNNNEANSQRSARYIFRNTFVVRDNYSVNFYTDSNTKNNDGIKNQSLSYRSSNINKFCNNSYQNINLNTSRDYDINNTTNNINIKNNFNNYNNNQKDNIIFDNYKNTYFNINNNNFNNIPISNKLKINQLSQINSTNQYYPINHLNQMSINPINLKNQTNINFCNPETNLINNFNNIPLQYDYYQNSNNNNYLYNFQQTQLNNNLIPYQNFQNFNQVIEKITIYPQSQSRFEIEREYTSNNSLNKNNISQLQISPLKEIDFNMRMPQELNFNMFDQKNEIIKPFPLNFQQNEKFNNNNCINNNPRIILHQTKKRRPLFKIPPSKKRSVSQGKPLTFINKYYDENFIMEEDNEEENLFEEKEKKKLNILTSNNRYKNSKIEYDISNFKNNIDLKAIDFFPDNNRNNDIIDFKNVENICLINSVIKSKNINESSEKYNSIVNLQDSQNEEDLKMSQYYIFNEISHTVIGTNINLDSDIENDDEEIIILKRKKIDGENNKYKTLNKIEKNTDIIIEKRYNNNSKEEMKKNQKYSSKTHRASKKGKLFTECSNTFSFNN